MKLSQPWALLAENSRITEVLETKKKIPENVTPGNQGYDYNTLS